MSTCSMKGCDDPVRARSYCPSHYHRYRTTGSPSPALNRIHLPAGPLVTRIHRYLTDRGLSTYQFQQYYGATLHRYLMRAQTSGHVTAATADLLAITVLGMTLDEIYGPDWEHAA